jgi:hypothetical protein
MTVPADLDRAGLEACRERAERLMNDLTGEAEAWAAAGTRKAGEVTVTPHIGPPPRFESLNSAIKSPAWRAHAA